MNSSSDDIITRLRKKVSEANDYFEIMNELVKGRPLTEKYIGGYRGNYVELPEELREAADALTSDLVSLGQEIAVVCKNSPLVTDVDAREVPIIIRRMRGAVLLNGYEYTPPRVLYGEDGVFTTEPSKQSNYAFGSVQNAKGDFSRAYADLEGILNLVDRRLGALGEVTLQSEPVSKYRPNTAFIMMWMNKAQPDLEDVRDTVREVFGKFGIRAVRADDIEHDGLITQRILDEIRTSEFLFADLTGERPSVYYEVGYAHALPRRVILFRKAGTTIHFDLAGYNCPEYQNLRDLREQLIRRLEALTNKSVQ